MKKTISRTAQIHGRGSQPYRWVSRLTVEEKDAVIRGGLVLIRDHHPLSGCDYKKVVYDRRSKRFGHRNYNPEP
jgi:hypothetical protein